MKREDLLLLKIFIKAFNSGLKLLISLIFLTKIGLSRGPFGSIIGVTAIGGVAL